MAGCESMGKPGDLLNGLATEQILTDPRNLLLQIDAEELDIDPQEAYGRAVIKALENKQEE